MYYYMVALAGWLENIFPSNSSFEWKHFPVSMGYVDSDCPTCHRRHACHQNFVYKDDAHTTIMLFTRWIVLLLMTMASNYTQEFGWRDLVTIYVFFPGIWLVVQTRWRHLHRRGLETVCGLSLPPQVFVLFLFGVDGFRLASPWRFSNF